MLNTTNSGQTEQTGNEFELRGNVTVTDPVGLHARPASLVVRAASTFPGIDIQLVLGSKTANAKSILSVISLGAKTGSVIEVVVKGPNKDDLQNALSTYQAKFEESQITKK